MAAVLLGIAEGENNDWKPASNGRLELEQDINCVRTQINAHLQCLPNEVDSLPGVDWINIVFSDTTIEIKSMALIAAIKEVPSVKDVLFTAATWVDKQNGIMEFQFMITTIFGQLQYGLGVDSTNKNVLTNS